MLKLLAFVVLAGCGGAAMQTLSIVNKTDRPIEAFYIYPTGAANHGASRGTLAPGASTKVELKSGGVEVMAVSAKLKFDEHHRDQPTASQGIELTHPVEVIFYDSDQQVPGLDRPNVIGVSFVINKPAPPPSE